MLLLSDGSVLCKTNNGGGDSYGNIWNKLSPDASGGYVNGTWSTVASMNSTRLYFSTQILKDGRVYVAGGEYGTGGSKAEIYDPVANTWLALAGPNAYMGDANSVILEDGRIIQATLVSPLNKTLIFNPGTNAYSTGPSCFSGHDESTWLKLPDNSNLFVDVNSVNSERYIPSLNQWITDAATPANLYDPYGSETGPAFLLPNGKAIFLGSLGNTAIYTPSGSNSQGSWIAGPSIPGGNGMPDATGAMMVDGKIIITASPVPTGTNSLFNTPTYFYEYDYINNSFAAITAPGGGFTTPGAAFNTNMLNLPDGNVLLSSQGSKSHYVRAAAGMPLAAGKPTITAVSQNSCTNIFRLTGKLFNGISTGSCYGDDWQMNTNFPIVRLTSGNNVYYARSYNWNSTGQQRGSLADSTLFSLSGNVPNGTYSLTVIANGISSDPVTFTFAPFPALTSQAFLPDICSGNNVSYNPVANNPNVTMLWTRPAVTGISNPAITTPQSVNPNEILVSTANVAKTVVYAYTLTNGSCSSNYQVSIVVNPVESIAVTGNTNICENGQSTLVATGIPSFSWSTGSTSNSVTLFPIATAVYTVSGYNTFGCFCSRQTTVNVRLLPTIYIAGPTIICQGDAVILTANGTGTFYIWSNGATTKTISVQPNSYTGYTVTAYNSSCHISDSINVEVQTCAGIKENETNNIPVAVYPNPFNEKLEFEATIETAGSYSVKIVDAFGQIVRDAAITFEAGKNTKEIELNELANGLYLIVIQRDKEIFRTRVIKE